MGRSKFAIICVVFFSIFSTSAFSAQQSCITPLRPTTPFKNESGELDAKWVQQEIRRVDTSATPEQKMVRQAAQDRGVGALSLNREIIQNHNPNYTHRINSACVTDQNRSGRCWLFASLNMLRPKLLADKLVDKNFEFSENYLYFFAMLEKSNQYLKASESAVKKNSDDRAALLSQINSTASIDDGGYFQWFTFLVDKYGLVPKSAMIEAASSVNTAALQDDLERKILLVTEEMRQRVLNGPTEHLNADLKTMRETAIKEVMVMLVTHLGVPPEKFEFRIAEPKKPVLASKKVDPLVVTKSEVKEFTPQTFAKEFVKFDSNEWVTVVFQPRLAMNNRYQLKNSSIGIEKELDPKHVYTGINLPLERLEQLTMASIDVGQPLYFSSDVKKSSDFSDARANKPATGILHPRLYDHDPIYGFSDERSLNAPRDVLTFYKLAFATHAMAITGYDRPDPNAPPIKFLVENSWGDDMGDKGMLHMYREWFYQNVYAVTIRRDLLSDAERAIAEKEPIKVKENEW